MTSVRFFKSLAAILALALMLSMLSINIFATDGAASEGAEGSAETTAAASDETTAAPSDETTAADDSEDTEKKSFPWDAVVSFGIVILAALVLLILYFVNPKFKKKLQDFNRSIKSELKKVVWSPKREVKKNTVIVLVFVAAFAILIGLLDFLFSKGIIALGKLF